MGVCVLPHIPVGTAGIAGTVAAGTGAAGTLTSSIFDSSSSSSSSFNSSSKSSCVKKIDCRLNEMMDENIYDRDIFKHNAYLV